jgi:hypothetical protein
VLQDGLEALLYDSKVDLVLQAHIHNYQVVHACGQCPEHGLMSVLRQVSWPVYQENVTQKNYVNPAAPVYVVNGAGGVGCDNGDRW